MSVTGILLKLRQPSAVWIARNSIWKHTWKQVKEEARTDKTLITRLVKDIEEHMVTNMAKDQYMDMGLAVLNSQQQIGQGDFLTVPGEAVETERFDEYHPDKEALKRMVVELFYKGSKVAALYPGSSAFGRLRRQ